MITTDDVESMIFFLDQLKHAGNGNPRNEGYNEAIDDAINFIKICKVDEGIEREFEQMETEMKDGQLVFILTLSDMDRFTRSIYEQGYDDGYSKGEEDGKRNYIAEKNKAINEERKRKLDTKG